MLTNVYKKKKVKSAPLRSTFSEDVADLSGYPAADDPAGHAASREVARGPPFPEQDLPPLLSRCDRCPWSEGRTDVPSGAPSVDALALASSTATHTQDLTCPGCGRKHAPGTVDPGRQCET